MFILFWGVSAVLYGLFWLLSLGLFLVGRKRKSRFLSWGGGLPLFLLTGVAFLVIGLVGGDYYLSSRPENIYREFFGFQPTADVTNIQSGYSSFDGETAYLSFDSSTATIQKITRTGWKRLTTQEKRREDFSRYRDDDAPLWWHPDSIASARVYEADSRLKEYDSESEMLTYDETTGQTYYFYEGFDFER